VARITRRPATTDRPVWPASRAGRIARPPRPAGSPCVCALVPQRACVSTPSVPRRASVSTPRASVSTPRASVSTPGASVSTPLVPRCAGRGVSTPSVPQRAALGHLSLVVLGFAVRHARAGATLMTPAPATVWATDSDAPGPRPSRARPRCDGTTTVARSTQARQAHGRSEPDSGAA
jgi:hypothetical protein